MLTQDRSLTKLLSRRFVRLGSRLAFPLMFLAGTVFSAALISQLPASGPEKENAAELMSVMHSITTFGLFDYVKEITSPIYEGRLTGTSGYNKATQWAADLFKRWNLKPAGDEGTYLQKFPNPYTLVLSGHGLSLELPQANGDIIRKTYCFVDDYYPGATSDSGRVTAEVVYVGFGISADELKFDEYKNLDVGGKLVLVEPGVPVSADREAAEYKLWQPYSAFEYKVRNAHAHGAAGVLFDLPAIESDCTFIQGLLQVDVGPGVVTDLFAGTEKKHDVVLDGIRASRQPASFATGKTLRVECAAENHPEGVGINVIAFREGQDPTLKGEAVVVGAHLDGLGRNPALLPGANDNAAGVAALLGVAEALEAPAIHLKRSVIFVLFGGAEQGAKGSEQYVGHPFMPNDKIKGFIDLERAGRGEYITGGAGGNYPELWGYFDRSNRQYIHRQVWATFAPHMESGCIDAAAFLTAGIPAIVLGAAGGAPPPYPAFHTSRDAVESLNPDIIRDIARLAFLAIVRISNS